MGRSILAVIAGYAVMAIAVMALFAIWFRGQVPTEAPSSEFMLFSIAYAFVFAVLGGYITALIARRSEMKHVLVLAAFGLLMGIVSMITAAGQEPLWYQITNMVVMMAAVILGGYLRMKKTQAQAGLHAAS